MRQRRTKPNLLPMPEQPRTFDDVPKYVKELTSTVRKNMQATGFTGLTTRLSHDETKRFIHEWVILPTPYMEAASDDDYPVSSRTKIDYSNLEQLLEFRRQRSLEDIPIDWVSIIMAAQNINAFEQKQRVGDASEGFSPDLDALVKYRKNVHWKNGPVGWIEDIYERRITLYRQRFRQLSKKLALSEVVEKARKGSWECVLKLVSWDCRWLYEPFVQTWVERLVQHGDPHKRLNDLGTAIPKNRWYRRTPHAGLVEGLLRWQTARKSSTLLYPTLYLEMREAMRPHIQPANIRDSIMPTTYRELQDLLNGLSLLPDGLLDYDAFIKFLKRNGLE